MTHDSLPTDDQQDDQIIGTAFRWSAIAIGLIAALVAAGVWFSTRPKTVVEETIVKDTTQIESLDVDEAAIPQLTFTDITSAAGITFVHENGAYGDKLLPETMGGGVAFFDYNNDDLPDLLLVNSSFWPEDTRVKDEATTPTTQLYKNLGGGQFENVTQASGLGLSDYGLGCAIGDYDNDGHKDVFVSCLGRNRLFHNEGDGTFADVSGSAGVEGQIAWSSSAGFFDYDHDGDLDLMVCNYVEWSRLIDFELNFSLNGTDRAYGPPTNYKGVFPYLYRNEGDGTFTDVAEQAGLQVLNPDTGTPVAKSLALVLVDVDHDGWDDIVVANDTVQNQLFHNNQDGTFEDVGSLSGVAFDRNGQATGAMGIDAAFPLNDRTLAIGVGNFANEMTSLYVCQDGALTFADQSLMEGIGAPSRSSLTFGLLFLDVDLDGRVEMLQTNGHLEEEINEVQPSQHYLQSAQLFWNQGTDAKSCYAIVPAENVGDLKQKIAGRGAAYADIDQDGDLDIVLTQVGRPAVLLRNDANQGGEHHWLRVKLVGTNSNRDAAGATIELTTDDLVMHRYISTTRSYLSQVESTATFGLGTNPSPVNLKVTWPGGQTQTLDAVPVDQLLTITQTDD